MFTSLTDYYSSKFRSVSGNEGAEAVHEEYWGQPSQVLFPGIQKETQQQHEGVLYQRDSRDEPSFLDFGLFGRTLESR